MLQDLDSASQLYEDILGDNALINLLIYICFSK